MSVETPSRRRWWQYKRTWFVGVPALVILGVVGLYIWGTSQPKPQGFAPTATVEAAAPIQDVDVVEEATPEVETPSPPETVTTEGPAPVPDVAPVVDSTRYTVDARSKQEWVLFDFNSGEVVDGDFTGTTWDIALQRTKLLTNSGVTNPSGPGGAYDLGEVLLQDAVPPEQAVFSVDVLGGEDEDEPENPAIGGWYNYQFIKHVISVKPNTYLVRTGEGLDVLVQFDSYYCEDEEPACVTFSYRMVPRVESGVPID